MFVALVDIILAAIGVGVAGGRHWREGWEDEIDQPIAIHVHERDLAGAGGQALAVDDEDEDEGGGSGGGEDR